MTYLKMMQRELKPGARPIAHAGRDDVAVCAADCRLMAFNTVEESLRFWIKVSFTTWPHNTLTNRIKDSDLV